ncbi:hypothetical protein [Archaeoglobus sp.]|uniref:hypothetical protein n=1 Tax=Archaeoglobus sp. TaxID=1872626 RepID=UPI0024AC07CB|nr:hypothetical protein [Archaeoglobus sp.]MDI3498375.1 hypothetical protein [Archaeoglobus sp.]
MITLLNLLLAEIAGFITYQHFTASPLRYFIPYPAELLLFAIPLVGLAVRRPFSFYYYSVLIFFNISPILARSETFEGIIDTLNAIDALYNTGTSAIAESLKVAFIGHSTSVDGLLAVTWLYILAEVFQGNWESIKGARTGGVEIERAYLVYLPAFFFALLVYFLYPFLMSEIDFGLERIVAAILGIAAFFAGVYLLSRGVEEEDINSGG